MVGKRWESLFSDFLPHIFYQRTTPSLPPGKLSLPSGELNLPSGKLSLPSGELNLPSGKLSLPSGELNLPSGKLSLSSGELNLPSGKLSLSSDRLSLPCCQSSLLARPDARVVKSRRGKRVRRLEAVSKDQHLGRIRSGPRLREC